MIFTHQFIKYDGFLMMSAKDNVAVVLSEMKAGRKIDIQGKTLVLKEDVEFGHKFATSPIRKDEHVIKYGEIIGIASSDISPGEHVHIHNVKSLKGGNNGESHRLP